MTETIKSIGSGILGGLVVLLGAVGLFGGSNAGVGGVYSNVTQDFSEGISVDETVVIDGSGNVVAPIATVSSASISGTGTTTLSIHTSTSGRGSCIELESTGGTTTRLFLGASSTVLTLENGTCE